MRKKSSLPISTVRKRPFLVLNHFYFSAMKMNVLISVECVVKSNIGPFGCVGRGYFFFHLICPRTDYETHKPYQKSIKNVNVIKFEIKRINWWFEREESAQHMYSVHTLFMVIVL